MDGVLLVLSLLAGRGAGVLVEEARRNGRRLAVVITAFVAVDIAAAREGILGPLRSPMASWPEDAPRGSPMMVTIDRSPPLPGSRFQSAFASAVRANVAVIDAYEPLCPRPNDEDTRSGRQEGLYGIGPSYRGEAWTRSQKDSVRIDRRSLDEVVLFTTPTPLEHVILNFTSIPAGTRIKWAPGAGLEREARPRRGARCDDVHSFGTGLPWFGAGVAAFVVGGALLVFLWRAGRNKLPTGSP